MPETKPFMQHNRFRTQLILLLLTIHFTVISQYDIYPHASSKKLYDFPFSITYFGAKHGIPQNQILDIFEKENGNLIIGTANGIVEYNGHDFFDFIHSSTYKDDIHHQIHMESATGVLYGWGMSENYNRIYPSFKKLADFSCVTMLKDRLVSVDSEGIIRESSYDLKQLHHSLKTGIIKSWAVLRDRDHYLVSDRDYLYKINATTGQKDTLLKGFFTTLKKNPYTNEIFVLSTHQVCKILPDYRIIKVALSKKLETNNIVQFLDIEFLNTTEYFMTSTDGFFYVNNDVSSFYSLKDGLLSSAFYGVHYYKPEDCIFIGTGNHGLMKLQRKQCKTYYIAQSPEEQSLSSVVEDKNGTIYSVGSKGNMMRFFNDSIHQYGKFGFHFASLSYIDQALWAGSWGKGVLIYKNAVIVNSIVFPNLPSNHVHGCFKDSRGTIWISTNKGIARGKSQHQMHPFSPIKEQIITMGQLKNGNICLGGKNGLYILDKNDKIILRLSAKDGLLGKEVRCFYEDDHGKIWIGTYGGGLYCYANKKLTAINGKDNCQLNIDIFTIAKDKNGYLYMTSNQGLWAIKEKKLNDFYDDKISYLIPFYYGEEAGILNTEFNGGFQNNFLQSSKGDFYFPSIQGLVRLKTIDNKPRTLQPAFKSIYVNDTLIHKGKSHFERSTHSIQFKFYSPNYSERYNVHYQYKLTGPGLPDPDIWSKLQKERSVSFKMLPPGDYIFTIRAVDAFNEQSPIELPYHFSIRPYFYETTLFWLLFVAALLLSGILIIRYRIRLIQKKAQKKHKMEHTILELKLKAIQSKMNPHFIFNSLNNIIYLLNTERYEEAEELLQDFSLLLRQFLEKSDNIFITIADELNMIELYLMIQQKRYNNLFTYQIICEEHLKSNIIPSMLIQPFVENALLHGIAHSNTSCLFELMINSSEKGVEVKIKDNGIGRKKSRQINKDRKRHNSHGIQLVNEKIKVIWQKYGIYIDLHIIDLSEETGTLIILNIPFHDKMLNS